jgi:3-hydroxybutyryl-CoA dehydratase
MTSIAAMQFIDLRVGQGAGFEVLVRASDVDRFAELSGDVNPLHTDAAFARGRGHADRVVHGAFLSALVSRLVGVHLPGRNCLLHSMNLQFRSPLLVGARVRVEGVVDQLSEAVQAAVLKVSVTDLADGRQVASGKVHLGFTSESG